VVRSKLQNTGNLTRCRIAQLYLAGIDQWPYEVSLLSSDNARPV